MVRNGFGRSTVLPRNIGNMESLGLGPLRLGSDCGNVNPRILVDVGRGANILILAVK